MYGAQVAHDNDGRWSPSARVALAVAFVGGLATVAVTYFLTFG